MPAGRFQHQPADEVMHEKMHAQFPFDVSRIFTTEMFHLQCGLKMAQRQFHFPASPIEPSEGFERIFCWVYQRGHEDDLASAKATPAEAAPH